MTALEHVARDLRYAWRSLRRDRVFTGTVIGTLAVALGLVSAAFTVFNAYVLRPYAVRDPYSLYEVRWRSREAGGRAFRWQDYEELRGRTDLFQSVIAERHRYVTAAASGSWPRSCRATTSNRWAGVWCWDGPLASASTRRRPGETPWRC